MSIRSKIAGLLTLIVATGVVSHLSAASTNDIPIIDSLETTRQSEIEEHRANRGMVKLDNQFIPKGQWVVGLNASFSTHTNDNYSFTIIEGINSNGYSVTASPTLAYTFKNNMTAGIRFEYSRIHQEIDSAMISISDIEIQARDYLALEQRYTAMATFRNYIPLGVTKRFALFAESRLEIGGTHSKFAHDEPVKGTYSSGYSIGVGVVPGIVAFATNNLAFEVSVGMMGLGYSHTDQVHNQVEVGEVNSTNLSFSLNLFSIGLGVATYF